MGGTGGIGVVEVDLLVGGNDEDTFVLGDESSVFYSGNADGDIAVIQDFQVNVDVIRLNADDPGGYGFGNDADNNGLLFFNDDIIATFVGVDIGSILNAPSFEFVS